MERDDPDSEVQGVAHDEQEGARGEPYRPLARRAKWVVGMLVVGIVADLAAVVSGSIERSLLAEIASGEVITDAESDANDVRQLAIGSLQGALFIATAIAFLFWFHRAYRNLPALGAGELRFGYGWAVGSWFVPILNLWRPKQIANDIWRESAPDPPVDGRDQGDSVPKLFLFWWLAYLVMGWLYSFSTRRAVRAEELGELRAANSLFLAADVVGILAAILAVLVVRRTTARESARARQLGLVPVDDRTPLWRRRSAWAALLAGAAGIALQVLVAAAVWSGSLGVGAPGAEPAPQAPSTAPPDALFADDFSRRGVWLLQATDEYSFDYVGGAYRIQLSEPGFWSSVRGLPEQVESLSVEVDATLHAGAARTDFYGASCSASSRGSYIFGISPDGYYTIAFDPGGDQVIDVRRLTEDATAGAYRPRTSANRLRAECVRDGDRTVLRLSVNGTEVVETVHRGDLGSFVGVELFAYSENGGTDVRFDDLVAREITSG